MDNLPEKTEHSPILSAALNPDLDVVKVEKLFELHERTIEREAKTAFNRAMSRAQKEMRPIVKDAHNQQTKSKYARLEAINRLINPVYTAHGFALSFDTGKSELEDHLLVKCEVSHEDGHCKYYRYDCPLDNKGIAGKVNKTDTHARGSSISYARRYLTIMIFNLAIADEDRDGNQPVQFITEEEQSQIIDLIKEKAADKAAFLKYLGCPSVEAIPRQFFSKAISALRSKK
jgi:hypothetical protein